MSTLQMLRALVDQRLTAAVEEIFVVLERTIAEYEAELSRTKEENNQLLDALFTKHQVVLHRTVPQTSKKNLYLMSRRRNHSPPTYIRKKRYHIPNTLRMEDVREDPQPTDIKEKDETPQTRSVKLTLHIKGQAGEPLILHIKKEEDDPLTPHIKKEEEDPPTPYFKEEKEDKEPPHIEEEEEEYHISQPKWLEEFPVTGVPVKSEDDEVKGESEEKREAEPPSSSSTQHINQSMSINVYLYSPKSQMSQRTVQIITTTTSSEEPTKGQGKLTPSGQGEFTSSGTPVTMLTMRNLGEDLRSGQLPPSRGPKAMDVERV
ncbi:uncharacterized protein LOC133545493 [Nerophis ophidion]|uniref:uncharacterized protein LOC133545493 n=1 Tax=Nerophis ophidion TaxID=159077 RepID=UPI002AE03271|nr:uncharacterized protein LOC133545493 [Nerophis ophidion]